MKKVIIGTKYQSYIDDELFIFRLVNTKEDKYILIDENGTKLSMTEEEFDKCIKLIPDATMNLFINNLEDGGKDFYMCIHKIDDLDKPSLILRQDVYSPSKNSLTFGDTKIHVGDIFTERIYPDYLEYMEIKEISNPMMFALYVDDTINEIEMVLGSRIKVYNDALVEIKKSRSNQFVSGYCDSLKELMIDNNFMYHFRSIFNITQIDFPIELDNNVSEDGVVKLNNKQINRIEDLIRAVITDVKVIKYDKDIDVSNIVGHTHMMVSDKSGNIYLVSYTIVRMYDVDDDILEAMNVQK